MTRETKVRSVTVMNLRAIQQQETHKARDNEGIGARESKRERGARKGSKGRRGERGKGEKKARIGRERMSE